MCTRYACSRRHSGKNLHVIDSRTFTHFKSSGSVRTNLTDSQQVFEWALYVTRVLLDLHPLTFHNCMLDRAGLAYSLAERHSVQCRAFISPGCAHGVRMISSSTITVGRMAKIKATKRSSGHARAEIRRRYAIAWVEYIDLSRPHPPRSRRRRRRYRHRLTVVSLNFSSSLRTAHPTLSSIVENPRFPPARSCTSIPIHLDRRPARATFVRSVIVPGIDDVALLCPDCIDPRGVYPRLRPVDDIMPRDEPWYRRNFFSLLVERHRTLCSQARWFEIANRAFHILFLYYVSICYNCIYSKNFYINGFLLYIIAVFFLIK